MAAHPVDAQDGRVASSWWNLLDFSAANFEARCALLRIGAPIGAPIGFLYTAAARLAAGASCVLWTRRRCRRVSLRVVLRVLSPNGG